MMFYSLNDLGKNFDIDFDLVEEEPKQEVEQPKVEEKKE